MAFGLVPGLAKPHAEGPQPAWCGLAERPGTFGPLATHGTGTRLGRSGFVGPFPGLFPRGHHSAVQFRGGTRCLHCWSLGYFRASPRCQLRQLARRYEQLRPRAARKPGTHCSLVAYRSRQGAALAGAGLTLRCLGSIALLAPGYRGPHRHSAGPWSGALGAHRLAHAFREVCPLRRGTLPASLAGSRKPRRSGAFLLPSGQFAMYRAQ